MDVIAAARPTELYRRGGRGGVYVHDPADLDWRDAGKAGGVQIFIGTESGLFDSAGLAMVVAPFRSREAGDQRLLGAIGVIGPARLNYARVIPLVDYTARVLGRLLDRG